MQSLKATVCSHRVGLLLSYTWTHVSKYIYIYVRLYIYILLRCSNQYYIYTHHNDKMSSRTEYFYFFLLDITILDDSKECSDNLLCQLYWFCVNSDHFKGLLTCINLSLCINLKYFPIIASYIHHLVWCTWSDCRETVVAMTVCTFNVHLPMVPVPYDLWRSSEKSFRTVIKILYFLTFLSMSHLTNLIPYQPCYFYAWMDCPTISWREQQI